MKIFLKIILFIGFIFVLRVNVNAQQVIWRQIIGDQFNEIGNNCIELRDGGYLMAGYKNIQFPGTSFIIPKSYLVRLDHYGNILWEKIIGDSSTPNSSQTLIEDSYGNVYLPYYYNYAHLAKLNPHGQILWIRDYSSFQIEGFSGIEFADGYKNIVLLGQNLVQGFRTTSVTKLDSSGNLIWSKAYYDILSPFGTYHSSSNSYWFSDHDYYICGFSTPTPGVENRLGFIIKLDTNGNIVWNKSYPKTLGIFSIAQNSENNFIGCGRADPAGYLFCQKFDSSGNVLWNRNYRNDSMAFAVDNGKIIRTYDNNFALGTTAGYNFGRLLIIDSLGDVRTSKYYHYPENFNIGQNNINNTSDSGFIVVGDLDSNNTFLSPQSSEGLKRIDALIFKIDKFGNTVSIRNNYYSLNSDFDLNVYPNPYNFSFKINLNITEKSEVRLLLYDISGKLIRTIENKILYQGNYQFSVNTPEFSSGVYFLKLILNNHSYSKKILLIK